MPRMWQELHPGRIREAMMKRQRKANIGASSGDYQNKPRKQHTIESLLSVLMPPKMKKAELKELDQFMCRGIRRNREAMDTYAKSHDVSYQDLNRTAVEIALYLARSSEVVNEMAAVHARLVSKKKEVPAHLRDRIMKPIEDLLKCCCPISEHGYHLWYYDDKNQENWNGLLSDLGSDVPKYVIDVFVSLALSELSGLGKITEDLKEEHELGIYLLDLIYGVMKTAEEAFDKILGEKG